MEENNKKRVKLIMVEDQPYIVSSDEIKIGDKALVTVGGQFPSIVLCENEMVLKLITDSKLSLTAAFKVFMEPELIKFEPQQIEKILENGGMMEVQFDGQNYNYSI
jgi:hypothetical protein